jgi:ATP-binding cassette subfamily C protein CydD
VLEAPASGPAWIQGKPAGSWATLILEQIDDMHDYYARYLPQMALAVACAADCDHHFPV